MATVSPPKPWERARANGGAGVLSNGSALRTSTATSTGPSPSSLQSSSILSSATQPSSTSATPPAIPERPSSLTTAVNRNATAYSPYSTNRVGGIGASPYPGIGSAYNSPYNRMGGYGGYGGYGSYGTGMYGGMGGYNSMYGGGMGGMYGGMGGYDPNDPNGLTHGFTQSTQATFQIIENIVQAFGGFAQMLESTYMATHSSFFAMVSVAEQFGNLRNTLGSILGIFALLRWIRTLFAKVTGRPPPADSTSLTPRAFASFEGRVLHPDGTSTPRPSKKPFLFFLAAAFGLPYLMGKLIRALAASQEEEQRRLAGYPPSTGAEPNDAPAMIDPSKLEFCRLVWDFNPENKKGMVKGVDMTLKKGDLVAVLSKTDPQGRASEWWRVRTRDGRVGWLPRVWLESATKNIGARDSGIGSGTASQGSRTSTLSSASGSASGNSGVGARAGPMGREQTMASGTGMQRKSKVGDTGVESFQRSQFYG